MEKFGAIFKGTPVSKMASSMSCNAFPSSLVEPEPELLEAAFDKLTVLSS